MILGHIATYFQSRSEITAERAFNNKILKGSFRKTGMPKIKIISEIYWFKNIPISLQKYTPSIYQFSNDIKKEVFYEIKYLPSIPLNEIFVWKKIKYLWLNIFNLCDNFFIDAKNHMII